MSGAWDKARSAMARRKTSQEKVVASGIAGLNPLDFNYKQAAELEGARKKGQYKATAEEAEAGLTGGPSLGY